MNMEDDTVDEIDDEDDVKLKADVVALTSGNKEKDTLISNDKYTKRKSFCKHIK